MSGNSTIEKAVAKIALGRPLPPDEFFEDDDVDLVKPAHDLVEWFRAAFIDDENSPAYIHDHWHLQNARIGAVWTNVVCRQKMARLAAMAEVPVAQGGIWQRARHDFQLRSWFGEVPHFLLTFDASYANQCRDLAFCAVVDHELCHCAQKVDAFGQPKFDRFGQPCFGIKAHDVEEFTGVIDRWGIDAGAGDTKNFVAAALRAPRFGNVVAAGICGTCLKKAA